MCVDTLDACVVTDVGITTPVKVGRIGAGAVPPEAAGDRGVPGLPCGEGTGEVVGGDGGPGRVTEDGAV
jgi:hypothetical protein